MQRFIELYKLLDKSIKKRLVVENDERLYSLNDCLYINKKTNIPVLFDAFHHTCYNNKETFREAIKTAKKTWKKKDGILMVDYSNQELNERKGKHAKTINLKLFKKFLKETKEMDFDVMLEIKDKEKSALKALNILKNIK